MSNGCAISCSAAVIAVCILFFLPADAMAQAVETQDTERTGSSRSRGQVASTARFLGGALAGLAMHEAGHVLFDVVFDADPRVKRVEFHGIPFFAITHRSGLSPRREFIISSAGFWMQHAGSEWILTRRPELRSERAPMLKGIVAFNVLSSAAYAGAAFARTGPIERDTRGMASAARIDERWVGALVLAPAALDAWRYFHPDATWATWTSRAVKIGMVLLVIR